VAEDVSSDDGSLAAFGVVGVMGPGFWSSVPAPPPAWEAPATDRHLYLADEYIRTAVESAVSTGCEPSPLFSSYISMLGDI